MEKYQKKSKKNTYRQILRYIITQNEFTMVDVANKLKKTLPTIHTCFKYLEDNNYICKIGTLQGKMGRKSSLWTSSILDQLALAVEVKQSSITIALHNLKGEIIQKQTSRWNQKEVLTSVIKNRLLAFQKEANPKLFDNIKTIGIALPGAVDSTRKKLLYSSNLNLRDIDFTLLQEELSLEIIVENNANAGVLGEFFHTHHSNGNIIFLSISEHGIGGGLIIEHKLQKGNTRRGGEIGHMSIRYDGKPCTCGNKGCLEQYSSEQGLLDIGEKSIPHLKDIQEIFQAPQEIKEKIIHEYVFYLAQGIKNLLVIFDPSCIILGGLISTYWKDFEAPLREATFKNNHLHDLSQKHIIKCAGFGENASLIGIGILTYYHHFYDNDIFS